MLDYDDLQLHHFIIADSLTFYNGSCIIRNKAYVTQSDRKLAVANVYS